MIPVRLTPNSKLARLMKQLTVKSINLGEMVNPVNERDAAGWSRFG
jgi:hypothetical protein